MKLERNCDNCGTSFEYKFKNRNRARFCSLKCASKKTKQEQDIKRAEKLANETREDWLRDLKLKFEKYVIKKSGCWDWSASCDQWGYGNVTHRNKSLKAHRVSYMVNLEEIPEKMLVLHKCDNPPCTNPKHLFLGTNDDNMNDMAQKGRNKVRAKLTPKQVIKIRRMIDAGIKLVRIAQEFGLNPRTITNIKLRRAWKDIV